MEMIMKDNITAFMYRFVPPSASINYKAKINYEKVGALIEKLSDKPIILNIGSGRTPNSNTNRYFRGKYENSMINIDIDSTFPNITVLADGHKLPFRDASLNAVIIDAVLEHVSNPKEVVNEIYRVLKYNGIVYAEIPFLQGFHADPYDYQRFTYVGIRRLFYQFKEIDSGICVGPSSAVSWILREYLAMVFSFNNFTLYRCSKMFFGWLTFWIKYLDIILIKYEYAKIISMGFYLMGRKVN